MSEDERQEMLRTATEAHADLKEFALRLRRRLPSKAPATKAAVKAEQELFRLRRELQRLELSDPDLAERRGPLPEVRRGGKVIDIERLRRGKGSRRAVKRCRSDESQRLADPDPNGPSGRVGAGAPSALRYYPQPTCTSELPSPP